MSNDLKVWLEPKRHSVEGHTAQATLFFNGRAIWGPHSCHNNTSSLRDALAAADPRFQLVVSGKRKSIEGHTYTISVMAGGRTYLNRLSTHGNMKGLCQAINNCLASEREHPKPEKLYQAPPVQPSVPPAQTPTMPILPPTPPPQTPTPIPSNSLPGVNPPALPPSSQKTRPDSRQGFEIAIICALKVEQDAVEGLLDEEFEVDGFSYGKALMDTNVYTTGRLGQQAVVLAYMPQMGKASSAAVATNLRLSFKGIKVAFLVGVCGAAPRDAQGREIFLGDVIISTAVIQVDFGRQHPDAFFRKDTLEDSLGRSNSEIRAFTHKLETKRTKKRLEEMTLEYVKGLCAEDDDYICPDEGADNLYRSDYRHKHHDNLCEICATCRAPNDPVCEIARQSPCNELGCDRTQLVTRERTAGPMLHFGRFASGDSVMKSGVHRDKIVAKDQVIAFEMEGAGSWDCLPTVIIKSACDYADSHKNKSWQAYASATAAACTKAVLSEWRNSSEY